MCMTGHLDETCGERSQHEHGNLRREKHQIKRRRNPPRRHVEGVEVNVMSEVVAGMNDLPAVEIAKDVTPRSRQEHSEIRDEECRNESEEQSKLPRKSFSCLQTGD